MVGIEQPSEEISQNSANPIPPPPTIGLENKLNWRDSQQQTKNDPPSSERPAEIINGAKVPAALVGAFLDPRKDKKPFSYFTGGSAPDLSEKPAPSLVRKTNQPATLTHTHHPKVLPIVSDWELEAEELRSQSRNQQDPNNMPLTHIQYNDPLNLYSKDSAIEALNQAAGVIGQGPKKFNPAQSGAYQMVHERDANRPPPPQHAAYVEEPRHGEEYPHYRGFIDQTAQSPSFKRLQELTGESGLDTEDELAGVIDPETGYHDDSSRFRRFSDLDLNPSPQFRSIQRSVGETPYLSSRLEHAPTQAKVYTPEGTLDWQKKAAQTQNRWNPVASPNGFGGKTVETTTTTIKHVSSPQQEYVVAPLYEPTPMDPPPTSDHPLDPHFAAKIAEAERPHVPQPQQPPWITAAAQKQQKWQNYGENGDPQQYERQNQPGWQQTGGVKSTGDKWQRHYGNYEFEAGATVAEAHKRAHSQEPRKLTTTTTTTTTKQVGKEPWMKPYVAPNIDDLKRKGQQTTTVTTTTTKYGGAGQQGQNPLAFGTQYSSRGQQSYAGTLAQQQPFTPLTSEQTRSLWQHESDAWSQRSRMEEEIQKRQANMPQTPVSPVQNPTGGVWRPGGAVTTTSVVSQGGPVSWRSIGGPTESESPRPSDGAVVTTTYSTGGGGTTAPVATRWQGAPGSTTKAQASGTYKDSEGHPVHYTKEIYTSSDPGREFSLLTEEEKKVREEPLQPGVLSRHVTTKYYKKSTFTNSTTTSGGVPSAPMLQQSQKLSIEAPPKPGEIGPGVSQF